MRTFEQLEAELRAAPPWRLWSMYAMQKVPYGTVATYGTVTRVARAMRPELVIIARNVAWLRGQLYVWIREADAQSPARALREQTLPLHRMAKAWDATAEEDSDETRADCERLRTLEGTWPKPQWWTPSDDELDAITRGR